MHRPPSRRDVLRRTGAVGAFLILSPSAVRTYAANEKLDMAVIGVGGRGGGMAGQAAGQNLVAVCDCDPSKAEGFKKKHPALKVYTDYRRMFEQEKTLNAVGVATPDHHHFLASMMAIDKGLAVYCEKPLTFSVWEARRLAEFARQKKVATQLGNQGHSGEGWRRLCEVIWAGLLGDVTEVHCRTTWAFSKGTVADGPQPAAPANLDWDAWIGPAPMRPYHSRLHPFWWRGWLDYGTGALGDQGCHVADGAFWALKIAQADSIEVSAESTPDNGPLYPISSTVTYKIPARAGMVPLTLKWFLGDHQPPRPKEMEEKRGFPGHGAIYYGTKAITYSEQYGGGIRIIPESKHKATTYPAATLERIKGDHWSNFIAAAKGGPPACGNFDYGGPLTELALLGNIAIRIGKPFTWNVKDLKAVNCPQADALVKRDPRKGWDFGYTQYKHLACDPTVGQAFLPVAER
jgi:predicted dehydrogenase